MSDAKWLEHMETAVGHAFNDDRRHWRIVHRQHLDSGCPECIDCYADTVAAWIKAGARVPVSLYAANFPTHK